MEASRIWLAAAGRVDGRGSVSGTCCDTSLGSAAGEEKATSPALVRIFRHESSKQRSFIKSRLFMSDENSRYQSRQFMSITYTALAEHSNLGLLPWANDLVTSLRKPWCIFHAVTPRDFWPSLVRLWPAAFALSCISPASDASPA